MSCESFVTYRALGAAGDGKQNDMPAIVAAHAYANEHDLPVRGDEGAVYYIGEIAETAAICDFDNWHCVGGFGELNMKRSKTP